MGIDRNMKQEDRELFQTHFQHALEGITLSFRSPFTQYQVWSAERKQSIVGAKYSREIVKSAIEQRLKDIQVGSEIPNGILDHVLKCRDTVPGCKFEDLVDMAVSLVFGGKYYKCPPHVDNRQVKQQ